MSMPCSLGKSHTNLRIQNKHRFGGMRDDRNFNDGMRNTKYVAVARFAVLTDGMRDCFKIDGGMRDQNQKITLRGELRL